MGLCASRSSARSTDGSEKSERSEKCRWDKHGNVFFPVRRGSSSLEENAAARRAFTEKNLFSNPVYSAEYDSPDSVHSRKGHFAGFAKLLRGSRGPAVEHKKHPLSPSRSGKSACKEMLEAKVFSGNGQESVQRAGEAQKSTGGERVRKHVPLIKFIEEEKATVVSLSRSSSAKEGSLTRSSSTKEAALSRCSSQKEGKRELSGGEKTCPSPDQLAIIASLKTASFRGAPEQVSGKNSTSTSEGTKPAKESKAAEASEEPTTSFLTTALGMPCYQPLVFRAVSPDKCRGRASSTHSSMSSEELPGVAPRRRSPSRRTSPGKKSPRKRSPSKTSAGNGGFTLNPSAARFQRSLPGAKVENQKSTGRPPQIPSFKTMKNKAGQENRGVLKELHLNGVKTQPRRQPSPVKAPLKKAAPVHTCEKRSVYSDGIDLDIRSKSCKEAVGEVPFGDEENSLSIMKEPRSGSKRLRSPKKPLSEQRFTRESLNFNLFLDDTHAEDKDTSPSKDKYIDTETQKQNSLLEDKEMIGEEDGETCNPEPELLELLERTPKKLKKMALKLALMIELEHAKEDESEEVAQQSQPKPTDVDLELKLGMASQRYRRRVGEGIRLDFSVAMDSPARTGGSVSVPVTPRHSVSSICNGLSVEARIGSSRGQSKSDFSFHVMKNPEKLFGNGSQEVHVTRREQREEVMKTSVVHVNASANDVAVDMKASSQHRRDDGSSCRGTTPLVERCPSFGFENDAPLPSRKMDNRQAPPGEITLSDGENTPRKHGNKDLNRDEETSPGFEFKVRSGTSNKSSPATPIMPSAPKSTETDALSLSADEIAEIWGAFEAGQDEKISCS